MAKRLTDTDKWKDNWFSNLSNEMKLIWLFILDDCNHAGLWHKNLRRLHFETNTNLSEEEIKEFLYGRIVELNDKWFIPKFIDFQYKNFIENNSKACISAKELLIQSKLLTKDLVWITEGLTNPYLTTKDKDMDMDTVKNKVMDKNTNKNIDTPFDDLIIED
jgi:hypothetical protein